MKRMPLLSAAAWTAMTVAALAGTRHVVPAGTEGNVPAAPYETWETAANDLRDALAVAQMGDEILVRPGVYAVTEQIAVTAKNLTIRSCDPVTGAPDRDGTVFDGSGLSGEAAGMFTVAAGVAGVTLDGLTLRNSPVGGLSCPSSPRTHVLNCAFTGNTANGASGGGAYISGNGAVVSNCLFEANRAARISGRGGNGGGLYMPGNEQTRGYVVDCVFRGNEAEASGGHVAATKAVTLASCTFTGTAGSNYGGVLTYAEGSALVVSNCTFTGLTVARGANALLEFRSAALLAGCSFTNMPGGSVTANACLILRGGPFELDVRNCLFASLAGTPVVYAFGRYADVSARVKFENCTVDAVGSDIAKARDSEPGYTTVSCSTNEWTNCILFCSIPSSSPEHANFFRSCHTDGDPGFVNPAGGDWSLRRSSPCRDQGEMLPWMDAAAVDLAGNPRVVADGVTLVRNPAALPDIGCYENQEAPRGSCLIIR